MLAVWNNELQQNVFLRHMKYIYINIILEQMYLSCHALWRCRFYGYFSVSHFVEIFLRMNFVCLTLYLACLLLWVITNPRKFPLSSWWGTIVLEVGFSITWDRCPITSLYFYNNDTEGKQHTRSIFFIISFC